MSKAQPEDGPRPWERPGAVRRDCEPHRALLLGLLARAGLPLMVVSSALNVCVPPAIAVGVGGVVAPVLFLAAVLPTAATWGLAGGLWWACHRDLALMRDGRVDPEGRRATAQVRLHAITLAAFPLGGLVAGLILMLLVW
jgi:hypothetical protein